MIGRIDAAALGGGRFLQHLAGGLVEEHLGHLDVTLVIDAMTEPDRDQPDGRRQQRQAEAGLLIPVGGGSHQEQPADPQQALGGMERIDGGETTQVAVPHLPLPRHRVDEVGPPPQVDELRHPVDDIEAAPPLGGEVGEVLENGGGFAHPVCVRRPEGRR